MQVRAITWAGIRTQRWAETIELFERLGFARERSEGGVTVLTLPNGDTVEVFQSDEPEHQHFTTGPVVGFLVDDIEAAVRELESAGITLIAPVARGGGLAWVHFRGPDGTVWELTARDG